jgi:5-(carboxyamino)imidazole ribonucleotide synthase
MMFHPEANLVEYLFAPADLSPALADSARTLALRLLEALDYVGIMAVEMFLTPDGTWLINEAAPRPHNSGHHTIRACDTSQYEQHLRAILGLPLGSTRQHTPAAMVNILGAPGHTGPAAYAYLREVLEMEGVYPHLYGKTETKPFRKMGHVTLLDPDPLQLRARALFVKDHLQAIVASELPLP